MEWGWNPDTLVAIATLGAMIAAVVAGVYAARSFGEVKQQTTAVLEQSREASRQSLAAMQQAESAALHTQMAREERERAQAELVSAWSDHADRAPEGLQRCLTALVQNASARPIYDVSVAVCLGARNAPQVRYLTRMDFLPPCGSEPWSWNIDTDNILRAWEEWVVSTGRTVNLAPPLELVFRDAAGQRWMRSREGTLVKHEDGRRLPEHWRGRGGQPLRATREERCEDDE